MCRYLRKYHHWQHLVCRHYWRQRILQRESILFQSPSKEIAIANHWFHNKTRAIPAVHWVSSKTVSTTKSVSSVSAPAADAQLVCQLDSPAFPATPNGSKITLDLFFNYLFQQIHIFLLQFLFLFIRYCFCNTQFTQMIDFSCLNSSGMRGLFLHTSLYVISMQKRLENTMRWC